MLAPETLRGIEQAVREAESKTAGEIAVVIAARSAAWTGERVAFALAAATGLAVLLAVILEPHPGWVALAFPLLFGIAWWIAGVGPLLRALTGSAALADAVQRAAKVAFVDCGVHATKTRAGVLIYVSLFERRVYVLGDSAVHAVVGDPGWQSWAGRVGSAMKVHDPDALLAVIHDVGATLADKFPRDAHDENELPDAVRVVASAR
jgi:putative membrane protein